MKYNKNDILSFCFPKLLIDLEQLVSLKTFEGSPRNNAAIYGIPQKKALTLITDIARKYDFKTFVDDEGRYGYIEFGEGEKTLGILAHLDVVPAGDLDLWNHNPFVITNDNGVLYARGISDDKGPAMAILYSLIYLKTHQFIPKTRIRFIFGVTEETSWKSIADYKQKELIPDYSIVADSEFPVVYGEKSVMNVDIFENSDLNYEIVGGNAYNMVCDKIKYNGPKLKEILSYLEINNSQNFSFELKNKSITIIGKTAHGSVPEQGKNAAVQIFKALAHVGMPSNIGNWIIKNIGNFDLKPILNNVKDESGKPSINLGIINFKKERQKVGLNLRFPMSKNYNELFEKIASSFTESNLTFKPSKITPPVYMPKESSFVKILVSSYQKVTNDYTSLPVAIGGATYSRAFPNSVAFGAVLPNSVKTEHNINEYIKLDDLKTAVLIYVETIAKLSSNPEIC